MGDAAGAANVVEPANGLELLATDEDELGAVGELALTEEGLDAALDVVDAAAEEDVAAPAMLELELARIEEEELAEELLELDIAEELLELAMIEELETTADDELLINAEELVGTADEELDDIMEEELEGMTEVVEVLVDEDKVDCTGYS